MVVSTTVVSTRIFLPSTAAVLLRQLDKSWMQMRNHLTLEKHRTYGTGPRYSKIGGPRRLPAGRSTGVGQRRREGVD
jgi:hypothetical protein